ncbi:MAG: hypothetical protein ACRCZZ_06100 [Phocaeicola sp.]
MALLQKNGFGQVEPNNLAGRLSGRVYAQKQLKDGLALQADKLQNGMFLVYDMVEGCHTDSTKGEMGLVYNEVKVYDSRESYKDFYVKPGTDGLIFPRIIGLVKGDVFTTNLVDLDTVFGTNATVGLKLVPGANGVLKETATPAPGDLVLTVVKETTMPDGQPALKLQYL